MALKKQTKNSPSLFELPTSFEMGCRTYKVNVIEDLTKRGEAVGMHHFHAAEIDIDGKIDNEELRMLTFYHEIFHALFESQGREDLSSNEALVDTSATLLCQMMKTAKYHEKS